MDEELFERIKKRHRETLQKAAKVEAALKAKEEREELAKMVEEDRERQAKNQRGFANPQDVYDIDGDPFSLDELADGYRDEPREEGERWKTREEILKDGTLLEKLRMYYANRDMEGYFNLGGELTKEDVAKIAASIRTEEDRKLLEECNSEYQILIEYGAKLSYSFKMFQTSLSALAVSVNKWDDYEKMAKQLTDVIKIAVSRNFDVIEKIDDKLKGEAAKLVSSIISYTYYTAKLQDETTQTEEETEGTLFAKNMPTLLNRAKLYYEEEENKFKVDVDGEGKLYSKIKEEAKVAEEDLSIFKAYVVVILDFIQKSKLRYVPISIRMALNNAESESYARYLVNPETTTHNYFKSELNCKKKDGAAITKDQEKRAVIPDYLEIEPDTRYLKSCYKLLTQLQARICVK